MNVHVACPRCAADMTFAIVRYTAGTHSEPEIDDVTQSCSCALDDSEMARAVDAAFDVEEESCDYGDY